MRSVSELLLAGYLGNLPSPRQLQHLAGLSIEQAAAVCMVSPETYRRWGADRQPNRLALRLLAIQAGYVPWQGWLGWELHNGFLFPPGYSRHGISPGQVMALPFLRQLVAEYRRKGSDTGPAMPDRTTREFWGFGGCPY